MLLATAAEMREADRRTIDEIGLPGAVLMENASQGAARVILSHLGPVAGLRVAAFCGRGNNGGDGLAIGRILANQGAQVRAFLLCRAEDLKGDAALNLKVARACGVSLSEAPDDAAWEGLAPAMEGWDLYLDALLGTGLNSPVRGRYARAIELLNRQSAPILAVDIPSGLCADTGRPLGAAVRAAWTATFGLVKLGLALDGGRHTGEMSCIDISIPPQVIQDLNIQTRQIDQDLAASLAPPRPRDGHKGTFGHLLVAGGSPGMSGALCLAALAGIRSGAGLVTAALPAGLNPVAEVKLTAAMSQPLPESAHGALGLEGLETLLELAMARSALVLGPGLSRDPEAARLVRALVARLNTPLVLDADGLNALTEDGAQPAKLGPGAVITPHPGEAARLLGTDTATVQADRPAAAKSLARNLGAVAVLKGALTLVASPDGRLWVSPFANPLLATGGSGDVLAGLIGGLLAQGLEPAKAACLGVWLQGRAGELAAGDFGDRGLAAEELLDYLPAAWMELVKPDSRV